MADNRARRIIGGDKEAFNSLCRERYPSLLSYARIFLTREWAEDVLSPENNPIMARVFRTKLEKV